MPVAQRHLSIVHTARSIVAIPDRLIVARSLVGRDKGNHFLAEYVVNSDSHISRYCHLVCNRCARIEGIGIIGSEPALPRRRFSDALFPRHHRIHSNLVRGADRSNIIVEYNGRRLRLRSDFHPKIGVVRAGRGCEQLRRSLAVTLSRVAQVPIDSVAWARTLSDSRPTQLGPSNPIRIEDGSAGKRDAL